MPGVLFSAQEEGHFYAIDHGEKKDSERIWYPSVTTILDVVSYNRFIAQWANNLGFRRVRYQDELDRTATLGTTVHALAQDFVDPMNSTGIQITDPLLEYYARKRMDGFKARLKDEDYETIFTEKSFASETYQIGGTMDWFCTYREKKTLFDFKTASGLREKFIYQLGGYGLILDDNGIEWEQAGIILIQQNRSIINVFPKEIIQEAGEIFKLIYAYKKHHDKISVLVKSNDYISVPTVAAA